MHVCMHVCVCMCVCCGSKSEKEEHVCAARKRQREFVFGSCAGNADGVACSVLQCVAVRCSVPDCSVLLRFVMCLGWCSVLQCVAECGGVVQCGAVWCSVLQCVAVCCSVLQCAAV